MSDAKAAIVRAFQRSVRWLVGCVTDPRSRVSSSARLISFAMTYTLHVYLTRVPAPDYRVVGILVTGGIIPLVVRTRAPALAPSPETN
jgi:hypothetical protein